ncbi:MAG: DUF6691 family protein [Bacteroidia bacterium]|nr:DUF6691 family protein [Bacteroidia bacterium]
MNTEKNLVMIDAEECGHVAVTPEKTNPFKGYFAYLIVGILFGIILTKSEAISWYRIQEMFRFQAFHMYGIIGSAVVLGIILVYLLKKYKVKSIHGEPIILPEKTFSVPRYLFGGTIFGMGWALTGACPGPLYILVGNGITVFLVVILSAVLGTWVYGMVRQYLPH